MFYIECTKLYMFMLKRRIYIHIYTCNIYLYIDT